MLVDDETSSDMPDSPPDAPESPSLHSGELPAAPSADPGASSDRTPPIQDAATPSTHPAESAAHAPNSRRTVLKGGALGQSYVRIQVPTVQSFRWQGNGLLEPQYRPNGGDQPVGGRTATTEPPATMPSAPEKPRHGLTLPGLEQRVVVSGRSLGPYVRRELSSPTGFHHRGANVLEVSERLQRQQSAVGRGYTQVRRVLLGRPLATAEQAFERLTRVKALAVLSSDAISSVAYATEASMAILIGVGVGALRWNLPIAACITLLMIIVGTSYRQTIHAYPHGGGSYIVARDNLGDWPGLVAAAALLIDYILTVSVSVSAGVDALTSAAPSLHPYSVVLGVVCILLIMVVNLRGVRESGTIFAAPTYIFVGAFLIMIVTGVIHAALSPGGLLTAVTPALAPHALGWAPQRLGILLILTAFASGCSAMTGVEAISNGVPAFKAPEANNAARTLVWMIAILVTLYLGTTYLAWRFGIEPNALQNPTVDSQIASLLFTGPFTWFYYLVQGATLVILVLAANTSFADFPRLSSILARDGFLPHQFTFRGDRLAFSTGIFVLSLLSIILLVAFHGSTEALINLYALGVFTAFTLSQSGMVMRWRRLGRAGTAGPAWRRSLVINGVGALATGLVALIILVTKFDRGAWIVVLLVPVLVLLFRGIAKHYESVRQQTEALTPLKAEEVRHVMVVPIAQLNRPALQSLAYARSLTQDVIAVHVVLDYEEEVAFRAEWEMWVEHRRVDLARAAPDATAPQSEHGADTRSRRQGAELAAKRPQLVVIQSPYRSLVAPLISYIDALRDANPGATVSVILPEFVPAHWWEWLLHNQTALRLKLALYSDPGVVVIDVPHHLKRT